MKKKLAVLAAVLMASAVLGGCAQKAPETETQTQTQTETQTETETETVATEAGTFDQGEALPKGKVRSYLTGKIVDKKIGRKRPYAIMLNNIYGAIPQAGIERADVVYEAPVEGAITRLMGIFEDYDGMEKIGSVRSCREYYVHFAKEFDALYVHYGQAVYACEILNSNIDNISGLSSQEGFGQLYGYAGEETFYRTDDRPSPHNCYTSADRLIEATKKLCYSREYDKDYDGHYQFAGDDQTVTFTDPATHIEPGYEVNEPWFDYNADEGVYYRYQYGDAQIDQLTGEQLKYDNVIFQLCECYPLDDHGYLAIEAEKGGTAYVFTKGTYEKCTWTKDDIESPARYFDEDGNEITINQGKTWVCVVYDTKEDQIVIE